MKLTNLICACCIPHCDKIRIDSEKDIWLSRSENPELYDKFIEGKELTHGYCPEHFKEAMKEVEEYHRKK
jgi:hypothetical protein